MKPQDLLFFTALIILIIYRRAHFTWHAGILCFVGSGLLFAIGNLFTAQRLTWYGAAFIFIYAIRELIFSKKYNSEK